jgi:elongation factor 2
MAEKHGKVKKMLKAIQVELKGEERNLSERSLCSKRVMQKWLPAGACVGSVVLTFPPPVKAQAYRADAL